MSFQTVKSQYACIHATNNVECEWINIAVRSVAKPNCISLSNLLLVDSIPFAGLGACIRHATVVAPVSRRWRSTSSAKNPPLLMSSS